MELNEIKKYLYKNPVKAKLLSVSKNFLLYQIEISETTEDLSRRFGLIPIYIPISEIEDGRFYPEEDAKHLIRWIKLD